MAREPSRAQDAGVSMKRLRQKTSVRLERIENTLLTLRWAWDELGDQTTGEPFDEVDRAVARLRKDLEEIGAYHDLPVGQEVEG